VTGAQLIELTGPALDATNGYTIGGATINPDGSWNGGVQMVLPATNGQVSVFVPPISAILLNPAPPTTPTNLTYHTSGNQLSLSWPSNYTGWLLQSNPVGLASPNWVTIPGSVSTNSVQVPIDAGQTNVFFRLALP